MQVVEILPCGRQGYPLSCIFNDMIADGLVPQGTRTFGSWFNIKMPSYQYRNPIMEIRQSYDRLISTMGFPILVRRHLYTESGPWWWPGDASSQDIITVAMVLIYISQEYFSTSTRRVNSLRPRQMDAIFQTTFSNAFSSMKMYEFLLKFHWSLFLGVQLTIFHHWFK